MKAHLKDPSVLGCGGACVGGCGMSELAKGGLRVPVVVVARDEQYRQAMNPIRPFFEEAARFHPDARCPLATLRAAYESWLKESGELIVLKLDEIRRND